MLLEKKTKAGLHLTDETVAEAQIATNVCKVLRIGPDAYKDKERFPDRPWCKEGDWIVMRAYSGTRIKVHGKEFRIINDDSVEAVVEDPRGVVRA